MSWTAELTRDGKWWHVRVPELDAVTQGRTLAEAEEMARDLIVLIEQDNGRQLDPDSIDLSVVVRLPGGVVEHLHRADELREQARETRQAANAEHAAAVRELRQSGVSMRDAGRALGLSHQRVSQLARISPV